MIFTEYDKVDSALPGDSLLIGGSRGVKRIEVPDLIAMPADREAYFEYLDKVLINADDRRRYFRGKKLTLPLTSEQTTAIYTGTFKGFFVGDYFEVPYKSAMVKMRIADFDYTYLGVDGRNRHHIVFVNDPVDTPDTTSIYSNNTTPGNDWIYLNSVAHANALKMGDGIKTTLEKGGFRNMTYITQVATSIPQPNQDIPYADLAVSHALLSHAQIYDLEAYMHYYPARFASKRKNIMALFDHPDYRGVFGSSSLSYRLNDVIIGNSGAVVVQAMSGVEANIYSPPVNNSLCLRIRSDYTVS